MRKANFRAESAQNPPRSGHEPASGESAPSRLRVWPEHTNLEQLRPVLSRDEQPVVLGVVGNAVQDIRPSLHDVFWLEETGQVDGADHAAAARVDAHDPVRLPYVGIDLPLHPFQFIHVAQGLAVEGDLHSAGFLKRLGIEESKLRSSVAHDDLRAIARQSPPLTLVLELSLQLEGGKVEDEADVGLPRQTDEVSLPVDDAFAEILGRNVELLHHLPGGDADLPNGRMSLKAGTLVQIAVQVEQALRKGGRIVGIRVQHLDAVYRDCRRSVANWRRRVADCRRRVAGAGQPQDPPRESPCEQPRRDFQWAHYREVTGTSGVPASFFPAAKLTRPANSKVLTSTAPLPRTAWAGWVQKPRASTR